MKIVLKNAIEREFEDDSETTKKVLLDTAGEFYIACQTLLCKQKLKLYKNLVEGRLVSTAAENKERQFPLLSFGRQQKKKQFLLHSGAASNFKKGLG